MTNEVTYGEQPKRRVSKESREKYKQARFDELQYMFWDSGKGKRLKDKIREKKVTSWDVLDWVANTSRLKGLDRLVALQIASHYNKKNGYAYPSYSILESETGLSRSRIAKAIGTIKKSGEWQVKNMKNRDFRNCNQYVPQYIATFVKEKPTVDLDSLLENVDMYKEEEFDVDEGDDERND